MLYNKYIKLFSLELYELENNLRLLESINANTSFQSECLALIIVNPMARVNIRIS